MSTNVMVFQQKGKQKARKGETEEREEIKEKKGGGLEGGKGRKNQDTASCCWLKVGGDHS